MTTRREQSESFKWTPARERAVLALAEGKTRAVAAAEAQVAEGTIYEWLKDSEFRAEMDRLSLMIGIASRAERLRIAMRVARQKMAANGQIETEKDMLDWLKFAQSETDGIKLDMQKLLGGDGNG